MQNNNLQKLKHLIANEYKQWYQIVNSCINWHFICKVVNNTTIIICTIVLKYKCTTSYIMLMYTHMPNKTHCQIGTNQCCLVNAGIDINSQKLFDTKMFSEM